jgi:hypothetical protein
MRCRNPWRLARRRLLGWNVRFTSCLLDQRGLLAACAGSGGRAALTELVDDARWMGLRASVPHKR